MGQLVRAYGSEGASILTPEELAAVPGPRRWLTGFYFTLVTVRLRRSLLLQRALCSQEIYFKLLLAACLLEENQQELTASSPAPCACRLALLGRYSPVAHAGWQLAWLSCTSVPMQVHLGELEHIGGLVQCCGMPRHALPLPPL